MNYKKSIIGSSIAFVVATSCCWLPPLTIAIGGGTALLSISDGLEKFSGLFITLGLGLFAFGIYQYRNRNRNRTNKCENKTPMLKSTITCPECGFIKEEIMPLNACQFFYECENCKKVLKPKEGDCCVYCSYGTVPCPPIQLDEKCC